MRIYLGGYLDFYSPDKGRWMEFALEAPTLLEEILQENGIPVADIQLVVINDEIVELDQVIVNQKDIVKVFPPVGGG